MRAKTVPETLFGVADLPLWSGTPLRAHLPLAAGWPVPTQGSLASCHLCGDSGWVRVGRDVRRCWCEAARENTTEDEEAGL